MDYVNKTAFSLLDGMKSATDRVFGRILSAIDKRRYHMENVLRRDITGECFGECRNTVREAEIKRQEKINKIMREAEANRHMAGHSSGMESKGYSSRA